MKTVRRPLSSPAATVVGSGLGARRDDGFEEEEELSCSGGVLDVEIDEELSSASGGEAGAVNGEMDIEIDEDEEDDDDDENLATWYFSVSLWRARDLLGNNRGGTSSDPYVLVKYGEQELKSRVIENTLSPRWKSHLMFQYDSTQSEVELFIFDFEDFTSDDILGKVSINLPNPISEYHKEDAPVFTLIDHEWLQVQPCMTEEQDRLETFKNTVSRRVTKALRVFHDDKHLYKKADKLGSILISVTAFKLEELPILVREREETILSLRDKLSVERTHNRSALTDTTLHLQSELDAVRRDNTILKKELAIAEKKQNTLAQELREMTTKAELATTKFEALSADRISLEDELKQLRQSAQSDSDLLNSLREKLKEAQTTVSAAENERDSLKFSIRKLERQLSTTNSHTNNNHNSNNISFQHDDLTIAELKERIQGLTLAYYWKLRKSPAAPLDDDQFRSTVNKYSLPSDPPLRLRADLQQQADNIDADSSTTTKNHHDTTEKKNSCKNSNSASATKARR